jgi:hypothetical protein
MSGMRDVGGGISGIESEELSERWLFGYSRGEGMAEAW